ncbi:MAG: alpha/beta fold hydrolase [Gammaproteobacteria bacterium]
MNQTTDIQRFLAVIIVSFVSLGSACAAGSESIHTATGAGGVPITYGVAGTGDTALVFVHGWSCDRSYWREQVPVFADSYRVVTVDLGGHGASPASRKDWSIESFGQDVAAVARAVNAEQLVLIGHSMSGQVVLDAAARLGNRVIGIIGVDTLTDASVRPLSYERASEMFSTPAEDFAARMDALARKAFFTEDTPAELVDQIANDMAAGDPVVGQSAGIGLAMYDIAAALANLDGVPLILINAGYHATNEKALNEIYAMSRVVLIPDSGHFVMLERPAAFNAALQAELDQLASGQ